MRKKLNKKEIAAIEKLDWSINGYTSYSDGKIAVEIEQYSPKGEDLVETIAIGKNSKEFYSNLYEHWDGFDVEEHVKMWLDAKESGTGGVPGIVDLVDDAKEIDSMYEKLSNAIYKIAFAA